MIVKRRALLLVIALSAAATSAAGQSVTQVPPGFVLKPDGVVNDAQIVAVVVETVAEIGQHTKFAVLPPQSGAQPEWFYVFNNSTVTAMERGVMIGLLMGAVQSSRWSEYPAAVNIRYRTIAGRKEVVAVALGARFPE